SSRTFAFGMPGSDDRTRVRNLRPTRHRNSWIDPAGGARVGGSEAGGDAGEKAQTWDWGEVLGQYLEAGGTTERFWRETPNTTIETILAYRRRRCWAAWQPAVLQRFDFGDDYP